jgi:hypothetical protein
MQLHNRHAARMTNSHVAKMYTNIMNVITKCVIWEWDMLSTVCRNLSMRHWFSKKGTNQ